MSDARTEPLSGAPEVVATTRLIKRYANRKMYDTERSCYITLEEVAAMVRAGQDLRVIDNKSKRDLTEVTLTQALLSSERKKRGSVSIDSLRNLFAQGGELIQSRVGAPVARAASEAERQVEKWRTEAEKTVGRVLSKKDAGKTDRTEKTDEGSATAQTAAENARSASSGQGAGKKKSAPNLVENTQRAYDEWQQRMDERVRLLVSALTAPAQTSDELVRLRTTVAQLGNTVATLGDTVAQLEGRIAALEERIAQQK